MNNQNIENTENTKNNENTLFPKHFQVSYQKYYHFQNLDPIIILLFILFIVIYFVAIYYKLN